MLDAPAVDSYIYVQSGELQSEDQEDLPDVQSEDTEETQEEDASVTARAEIYLTEFTSKEGTDLCYAEELAEEEVSDLLVFSTQTSAGVETHLEDTD